MLIAKTNEDKKDKDKKKLASLSWLWESDS